MNQVSRGMKVVAGCTAAVVALGSLAACGSAAQDDGDSVARGAAGVAEPTWVVSLGDSYISGEAGQWRANTTSFLDRNLVAAPKGAKTYDQPQTGTGITTVDRCHRSESAAIHIGTDGNQVKSANIACSGATQPSDWDNVEKWKPGAKRWKPGIDFDKNKVGGNNKDQAQELEKFAKTHKVSAVAVSIGGNDMGFGDLVADCVSNFASSSKGNKKTCAAAGNKKIQANAAKVTNAQTAAYTNIQKAMRNAGYKDDSWRLIIQTYPSPLPDSSKIGPSESNSRQSDYGCGFWNSDLDWANNTLLPALNGSIRKAVNQSNMQNVTILNVENAFVGNRLCEKGTKAWTGTHMFEANDHPKDAVEVREKGEWVQQITTGSAGLNSPLYVQESLHPNYWGQLALRNCMRMAYEAEKPSDPNDEVICVRGGSGVNQQGEPNMKITEKSIG